MTFSRGPAYDNNSIFDDKRSKFIKFILSLAERVTKIVKGLFSTSGPYRSKNTSIRYLVGKLTK